MGRLEEGKKAPWISSRESIGHLITWRSGGTTESMLNIQEKRKRHN